MRGSWADRYTGGSHDLSQFLHAYSRDLDPPLLHSFSSWLVARKPQILIDAPAASGVSNQGRSLYMHWQVREWERELVSE